MVWPIVNFLLFLAATGYGIHLFVQAVYRRYTYLKLGQPADFRLRGERRAAAFLSEVFGHRKLLNDRRSGLMHFVLFYGFVVLQFGALDLIVKGITGGKGLPIPGYDVFGFLQETTVFLVLVATGYAAYRRYVEKLPRLNRGFKPGIVLVLICALMLSVLLSLAFERIWFGYEGSLAAPLSSALAAAFGGVSGGAAAAAFYVCWWLHLLILLAFLVYVPQSKHFHIIAAPINVLFRRRDPPGRLSKLDLESDTAESFGAGRIEDFTRKQLLDLYACVECGRCTNACPASGTGKALSPMHLIVKLRDHLLEKGAAVTSKSPWVPAFASATVGAHAVAADDRGVRWKAEDTGGITDIRPTLDWQQAAWRRQTETSPTELELIGGVITEDEIWSCTTCRNCEEQCPVGNEHVDKIVDMRRHLVLMRGSLPHEAKRAVQNIERQGNPWGISRNDRSKWTEELAGVRVPTVRDNPDFEYLFFVGSMGSYDPRSRKVTRAFIRLLNEGGVNYAILGNEERNSGDTPRRLGDEFLFQRLCAENIATFRKYGVRKIVTACPHTYNTLKNEYPDFGLEGVQVIHHTELLGRLVRSGRLTPRHEVRARVTYHDSCYLGRHNGVYDPPRDILRAIPGVELVEMERSRGNAMCCGAGGGMMWMEEIGKRVNLARTEQALVVAPAVIASACPYCLTMMEDGVKLKGADERVKARDVAELLAQSVFGD